MRRMAATPAFRLSRSSGGTREARERGLGVVFNPGDIHLDHFGCGHRFWLRTKDGAELLQVI